MPFASYAWPADVARAHHIHWRKSSFIRPVAAELSEHFRAEMAFTLNEVLYADSEAAICESLTYPLLREVWKPYRDSLTLWSHQPLAFDDDLNGVPDYMISRRSSLEFIVPDQPFLLVVEAKRDDFERGWGLCLAAMRAAQKLCEEAGMTFYGASTNGRSWESGQLEGDSFTQDPRPASIQDLDGLAASLNDLMVRCRDKANRPIRP